MIELPNVSVTKSSIPIIWLDTYIVFYMTQWKLGKSIDAIQKDRVTYLYNTIYELSRKKKLICPISDQKEEIWIGRKECLQTMLELSLGVHSIYSLTIRDYQTKKFMEAFLSKKEQVDINYQEFFADDPQKNLRSNTKFIISADLGLLENSDEIKKRNINQANKLENLRLSILQQGITYEEQLQKEFESELEGVSILSNKSIEQLVYSDFIGINDYWLYWHQLKGKPTDFLSFFYSPYYFKIPFNDIFNHMSAKIMTGNDPIKPSHKMDIYHAASALPYINLFITDRYMRKIICDLELNKSYKTLVLNISEIDKIENFFKDI